MEINKQAQHGPELLAPDILVTKRQFKDTDPSALTDAVIAFCDWCVNDAHLPRTSIQPDAWLIYYTSLYLGQVNNGGHGQFAGNTELDLDILAAVDDGLLKLGLEDLRAIFRRFTTVMAADKSMCQHVVEGAGFGDIPAIIAELDDAFFVCPDRHHFVERASDWLRGNLHLLALSPSEKRRQEKAIISSRKVPATDTALLKTLLVKVRGIWKEAPRKPHRITTRDEFIVELHRLDRAFELAIADDDITGAEAVIADHVALFDNYRPCDHRSGGEDLLRLGTKLLLMGERWGSVHLLERAADTIRRAIAEGCARPEGMNASYAWRALGDALVSAARIDSTRMPSLSEALTAFDQAIAVEAAKTRCAAGECWIGKAEAMILLATTGDRRARLSQARSTLDEAPALHTLAGPSRAAAAEADILLMLPEEDVTEAMKKQTRRMVNKAISVETDDEGAIWYSPFRLSRLQLLRESI